MANVQNMLSPNGNKVANQFEIHADGGCYFQSYNTVIAFRSGPVVKLDPKWDYSRTTSKYLFMFLGEKRAAIESKIKSGEYVIADLN